MTLQNRIWASRIKRLPVEEINEVHLLGLNVLVGEKAGKVTKQLESDETGERYEVELEDGTIVDVAQHEVQIADAAATEGEPSDDIQAEETEQVDEYIKADGTRRKCKGGDGRRTDVDNVEEEEEQIDEYGSGMEDEEEPADYEAFFKAALKKYGVESPADFKTDEDKKEFFDYVDKNFKGKKEKKESFSAEELAHFESVLKKNEGLDLDEAQSVPLVRRGQGTSQVDTHPSDAERLYQAKDKKEYEKLMSNAEDAMRKGMLAKFGLVGDYKKFTVNIKFKDAKSRKKFEKMNNIK